MNPGNSPKRIAIITRSLMMGGTQQHIVKLCQNVDSARATIHIFMLVRDEPDDLVGKVSPHVKVWVSPYGRYNPLTLFWLASKIRQLNIEVIESFLWLSDFYASLLKLFFPRIPVICSERGDRCLPEYYRFTHRFIDRWFVFKLADRFCANSNYGAKHLTSLGCHKEKVICIPNGVDISWIDSIEMLGIRRQLGWEDKLIIGIVSRLVEYKGVDSLVKAMSLINDARYCCVIVGDGPEYKQLSELSRILNITDRVHFYGRQPDPVACIKDFNIAVMTTNQNTEHCSNSILEYMACGKPVIATNMGGNPELVNSGCNGLLVPANSPQALANAIAQLAQSGTTMKEMGHQGRSLIEERYDIRRIASQFADLWNGVVNDESIYI